MSFKHEGNNEDVYYGYVVFKYPRISWETIEWWWGRRCYFAQPPPHKVRTYKEYHSVCPSSELGLPPTPHPQASVPPPPCFWGEGNARWRERGWESPNSDEGHTLWYSLYVRTLCPTPFYKQASRKIYKDDVNSFSPPRSDFCFMLSSYFCWAVACSLI
jgi:hypothetical protein